MTSKPTVKHNGEVWLNGQRIGEVQDNGLMLSSQRTGKVWQHRARPWQKWQGFEDTRREAVADLLKITGN